MYSVPLNVLNVVTKMAGVAEGLFYLHSNDVVHGDLKGVSRVDHRISRLLTATHKLNILFDNAGTPRIADFGISSITFNPESHNASTIFRGCSMRWTAPEILVAPLGSELSRPKMSGDVYAFAMVVIEVNPP